jgi:putative transposase
MRSSPRSTGQVPLTGDDGLLKGMLKAALERGLEVELSDHVGYERGDPAAAQFPNSRNGTSAKTVASEVGDVELAVPRDRNGTFTPQLVPKGSRRLGGLDEMIISLYAGGMTVRDIAHHLASTIGTELSHETIAKITDEVAEEVLAWQRRPLEPRRIPLVVANPGGKGFGCQGMPRTRCRWRSSAATSS